MAPIKRRSADLNDSGEPGILRPEPSHTLHKPNDYHYDHDRTDYSVAEHSCLLLTQLWTAGLPKPKCGSYRNRSRVIRRNASGGATRASENIPSPRHRAKTQLEQRSVWFPCLYLASRRSLANSPYFLRGTIMKDTKIDVCPLPDIFVFCLLP
jgi:hypothetical protein